VTTLTRVDVSSWANMHCNHAQTSIAGLLAGSRGKSTDLYSGGTRFESKPGHPKFFEVILTHLQRMSGQHQAKTEPFHILSNRVPYNPNRWTLCRLSYWQRTSVHRTLVRRMHLINPLNAELNPTCHLLALLGAHHILHVSRIRVKGGVQQLQSDINVTLSRYQPT